MSSIIETIQKRTFHPTNSLPLSHSDAPEQSLLRRRLSSLSLNLQPAIPSPSTHWTAFRRSKSVSAIHDFAGSSLRRWWDWSWSWVVSRKPIFSPDLETHYDHQTSSSAQFGSHCIGGVKHLFYKIRKLVGSDNVGLPQTYRYDSINYAKNFDDGRRN